MAKNSYGNATENEIADVLDLIAKGEPIPGGFAYNGSYDPPVWRVPDQVKTEHMRPPGASGAPDAVQTATAEIGVDRGSTP